MANSKPITHEQIIEEGIIKDNFHRELKELAAYFPVFTKAYEDMADKLSKSLPKKIPKNLGEVKEFETQKKKIDDLTKANEALAKAQSAVAEKIATVKEITRQVNLETSRQAKLNTLANDSLAAESIQLEILKTKYRELSEAKRKDGAVGGEMLKQIQDLDLKLKSADATLGVHNRNIGNYHGAITQLGKGLGGLTGLFATVGNAIGINTDAVREAATISKELIKVTKELHHAKQLENVANEESIAVKESEIVANEELAASQTAALGPIALVTAAIVAAGLAVYNYSEEIFGLSEAQKDKMRADDGTIISNEKVRDSYNENLKVIRDLKIEYDLLTGRISELGAELQRNRNKYTDEINKLNKETKEKLEENSGFWSSLKFAMASSLGLGVLEAAKQNNNIQKILKDRNRLFKSYTDILTEEQKIANEKYKKEVGEAIDKTIEELQEKEKKNNEKRLENKDNAIKTEGERVRKALEDERKYEIEALQGKYGEAEQVIAKQEVVTKIAMGIVLPDELMAYNEQILKEKNDAHNKELKEQEDYNNKLKKYADEEIARYKDYTDKEKDYEIKSAEGKILTQQGYIDKKEQLIAIASIKEKARQNKATQEELQVLKELNEKKISAISETEEAIFKGVEEGLQKKSDIIQKADQKDIDQHQRLIDVQAKLAAEGQDNVLAQTIAQTEKLEEKKLQDAKKAQKEQEGIQLANLIFELTAAYAKAGNTQDPEFKALAKALSTKAIASLVSGSFKEGTENTGHGGDMDKDGGFLAMLHPEERVLTKEQNKKIPIGISNDMLADMASIYTPIYNSANSSSTMPESKSGNEMLVEILTKEITGLRNVIENKPVYQTNLNGLGEWTDTITRNNRKIIINHFRKERL